MNQNESMHVSSWFVSFKLTVDLDKQEVNWTSGGSGQMPHQDASLILFQPLNFPQKSIVLANHGDTKWFSDWMWKKSYLLLLHWEVKQDEYSSKEE